MSTVKRIEVWQACSTCGRERPECERMRWCCDDCKHWINESVPPAPFIVPEDGEPRAVVLWCFDCNMEADPDCDHNDAGGALGWVEVDA